MYLTVFQRLPLLAHFRGYEVPSNTKFPRIKKLMDAIDKVCYKYVFVFDSEVRGSTQCLSPRTAPVQVFNLVFCVFLFENAITIVYMLVYSTPWDQRLLNY